MCCGKSRFHPQSGVDQYSGHFLKRADAHRLISTVCVSLSVFLHSCCSLATARRDVYSVRLTQPSATQLTSVWPQPHGEEDPGSA